MEPRIRTAFLTALLAWAWLAAGAPLAARTNLAGPAAPTDPPIQPAPAAQAWDPEYELRAQEVVAGLARLNGLKGWAAGAPGAWPESPAAPGETEPGRAAPGVRWLREAAPARLESLSLEGQGLTRAADLSGLTALKRLEAGGNSLRAVNIEGNRNLVFLGLTKNQIAVLHVESCPDLVHLAVSSNQLERLDISRNPRLRTLLAAKNRLMELDPGRAPDLENLEASNNRLSSLRVTANPRLTRLVVSYNRLAALDLSANPHLTELAARDNQLTRLDLSANPRLTALTAGRNRLTGLDLSANPALTRLTVDQNQLTRLDLTHTPVLATLEAQDNPLTEIRLGDNALAELWNLNLDGCRLPLSALAPLSGRARSRARFGTQDNVLFEHTTLTLGQPLDLSAEAVIGGVATTFTALTDKRRRLPADAYREENGVVTFRRPGRYLVAMTNDRVVSTEINRPSGRVRSFKVKVQTGVVEVLPGETGTEAGGTP